MDYHRVDDVNPQNHDELMALAVEVVHDHPTCLLSVNDGESLLELGIRYGFS